MVAEALGRSDELFNTYRIRFENLNLFELGIAEFRRLEPLLSVDGTATQRKKPNDMLIPWRDSVEDLYWTFCELEKDELIESRDIADFDRAILPHFRIIQAYNDTAPAVPAARSIEWRGKLHDLVAFFTALYDNEKLSKLEEARTAKYCSDHFAHKGKAVSNNTIKTYRADATHEGSIRIALKNMHARLNKNQENNR